MVILEVRDERGCFAVVENKGRVVLIVHDHDSGRQMPTFLCRSDNPLASSVVSLLREAALKEGRLIFSYFPEILGKRK